VLEIAFLAHPLHEDRPHHTAPPDDADVHHLSLAEPSWRLVNSQLPTSNAQELHPEGQLWELEIGKWELAGSASALFRSAAPRRRDLWLEPPALIVQLPGDLPAQSGGISHHVIEAGEKLREPFGRERRHPPGTITER
jgi:hypothetical protein